MRFTVIDHISNILSRNSRILRLEDGILSTRNAIQSRTSQKLNDQERRNYVMTPEMKRSKSPILVRLLMGKKKRQHSTSSIDKQKQLDNSIEQPRTLELNTDQSLQSVGYFKLYVIVFIFYFALFN